MSAPIRLTDNMIDAILTSIEKDLRSKKIFDGKVSYSKTFAYNTAKVKKARLKFTRLAYAQMLGLVNDYSSEVGWHGSCHRLSSNEFLIDNIEVYPQIVSGTTVTTEDEEYNEWLNNCTDETFNSRRFHGHSHVYMTPSPSGVDTAWYDDILHGLAMDDFYVFMIINKNLKHSVMIYDLKENMLYDTDDIEIAIINNDGSPSGIDPAGASITTVMWQCVCPEMLDFLAFSRTRTRTRAYSVANKNKQSENSKTTPAKASSKDTSKPHPSLSREDDPETESKLIKLRDPDDTPAKDSDSSKKTESKIQSSLPAVRQITVDELDFNDLDYRAVGVHIPSERQELALRLTECVNRGEVKNEHIDLWIKAFELLDDIETVY